MDAPYHWTIIARATSRWRGLVERGMVSVVFFNSRFMSPLGDMRLKLNGVVVSFHQLRGLLVL